MRSASKKEEQTGELTWAEVDDVARHLRVHHLLDIHANLEVVSSSGRTEVFDSGDLVGEPNASRALDAPVKQGRRPTRASSISSASPDPMDARVTTYLFMDVFTSGPRSLFSTARLPVISCIRVRSDPYRID